MKNIAVAIDGPAGAGKSSISKEIAKRLGFVYIDTGAMYRASALWAIENNVPIEESALIPCLDKINIEMEYQNDCQVVLLNGADVSKRIRDNDVSMGASAIAVIPAVRLKLVELQRAMAKKCSVIMDGRDIGTYVLPDAELKVFLTASLDERAKRRYKELIERGTDCEFESIKADIKARDYNDSHREFAPLKQANDAVLLDTTDMSIDEVLLKLQELINEKL